MTGMVSRLNGNSDDDSADTTGSIVSIGDISNSTFAIGPGATVVNGTVYVDEEPEQ